MFVVSDGDDNELNMVFEIGFFLQVGSIIDMI